MTKRKKAGPDYCVYTYYGYDMTPLYVGKTKDFFRRDAAHRKAKWRKFARQVGIRHYKSEADMNIAEVYYIATKKPRYNKDCTSVSEIKNIRFKDASEEAIEIVWKEGAEW